MSKSPSQRQGCQRESKTVRSRSCRGKGRRRELRSAQVELGAESKSSARGLSARVEVVGANCSGFVVVATCFVSATCRFVASCSAAASSQSKSSARSRRRQQRDLTINRSVPFDRFRSIDPSVLFDQLTRSIDPIWRLAPVWRLARLIWYGDLLQRSVPID